MRRAVLLPLLVLLSAMSIVPTAAKNVWLAKSGTLARLEIDTASIRAVSMSENVRFIAPIDNDEAWVLTDRALVRVDATLTERARAKIDPVEASTSGPLSADTNSGGVWVAIGQRIVEFDATGERIGEWSAGEPVRALAVIGPDAILVASAIAVARYDSKGTVLARVDLSGLPGSGANRLLVDSLAGLVWLSRSGALVQLDVLAGLAPRGGVVVPTPDALSLDPFSGVLTTITERQIARYGRDFKPLVPTSFASESLADPAGIEAEIGHSLLWFGDRVSLGAVNLDTGAVLRIPATNMVNQFVGSSLHLEPTLGASTPEQGRDLADTLVVLKYGAKCDGVNCTPSSAYRSGLRLEAYLGNRSVSSLFARELPDDSFSGRVPAPGWQSGEALRAWVTDAYGNRSDAAMVIWPVIADRTGGASVAKTASPPTVTITAPLNNAAYTAPAAFTIKATATPGTGATITKVEFFSGATSLGTVTASPYNLPWNNIQVGAYSLTAKVTDSAGATATSTAILITVNAGAAATPIAAYLLNESWTSPGVVTDAKGVHNGVTSGTVSAIAAPAAIPKPDTCKAASLGGGAIDVTALPVSSAAGAKTTVAFWMYWSGTDAVMPLGWVTHDLLFSAGSFGFSTLNGDVYGIASAGLANSWHHVVAEFTNGNVAADKIYLDGVPQTLTQRAGTPNNTNAVVTTSLRIGGLSGATGNRFAGKLDEIRVFSRALAATEVSAEFAAGNACGTAPIVTLTAPANSTNYVAPATIAMTAAAAAMATTLTKVEFYNGATLLGTSTASPYAYTWSNVAVGAYSLTAKATDAKGMAATSGVANVQVKANVVPVVSLTAPANNTNFTAPATINFAATATDTDGTIAKVEFYQGSTKLATVTSAPYAYSWTNVAGGNYALTAKATDDKGAITTSAVVNVKVNKPPTVSITAPANNGVVVLPATITINATATDADGTVAKVDFYRDAVLLGTDTTSPYSYTWTNATPGTYLLTAKATDNLGVETTSVAVTIAVNANRSPTVAITSPANGAQFVSGAPLTIAATASDPDGSVTKVDFYADNGTRYLQGTDTTAPYSVAQPLNAGTYVLTAVATDNKGATATSTSITVTVVQNQLPVVALTSPTDGQVIVAPATPPNITLTATASDPDGSVAAVRFYKQAQGVGGDASRVVLGTVTAPPYQFVWQAVPYTDPPGVSVDDYVVWAEATDNGNAVAASNAAVITVLKGTPRTIQITSPYGEAIYAPPATIVLTATTEAIDSDPVAKVEFVADGNVIGTVTSANGSNGEYVSVWRNVAAGTKAVTARVTDTFGSSVSSDPMTIQVAAPPQPLTVVLQTPVNAQTFSSYLTGSSDVPLLATLTDPNGAVGQVSFTGDYRVVGSNGGAPYAGTWSSVPGGVHVVTAQATDALGGSGTSSPAYVSIPLAARPMMAVLTSPSPTGSYTTSTPITLAVEALSLDGPIAQVAFYYGPYLLGTVTHPPYTMTVNSSAGQQTFYAIVSAGFTMPVVTTPVTVTVTGSGSPPSLSLTSPTEGQQFNAPASIPLTVSVNDPNHLITQVRYYSGAQPGAQQIAASTQPPYAATWAGVAQGSYTLTAVGMYASGGQATSAPVHVAVAANAAPSIAITAPTSGTTYAPGQSVVIAALASTSGHALSHIDFSADGAAIGSINVSGGPTSATVSFTWSGAAAGVHAIVAKAIATDGFSVTSAPISITVTDIAVALVEPFAGQSYLAPANIRIAADPSETGGAIAQVDFYGDGSLLGSRTALPYTFLWAGVPAGSHSVTVVARDSAGLTRSSPTVTVAVLAAPTIQVDAGIDGAGVGDDNTSVSGTVQAPPNAAVIVNGKRAALDRNGQFFVSGVQLQPGSNVLTLVLNTQDAAPVTKTIAVSSSGVAPFQVTVDPQDGLAPLASNLTVYNRGDVAFQRIEVDTNDDGTPELTLSSLTNQQAQIALNYPTPGVYTVRVTVFDASNTVIYLTRRKVRAYSPAELGAKVVDVYASMVDRLGSDNPAAALKYFSGNAKANFSSVFAALGSSLPVVATQLGSLVDGVITEETAELTLVRNTSTGEQTFMIYLIRGGDGLWRIESM